MSAGMPELGSKISLISKADIRYEGRLFTVDPQECTIALASVRSFGTEDRETKYPVAPQNQVYDYILFRGSDIKDIRVVNNHVIPNDPAIMQLSVPSLGPQPYQQPTFGHPVLGHMASQIGQYPPYGAGLGPIGAGMPSGLAPGMGMQRSGVPKQPAPTSVLDLISGGSRSTTPVSLISRKSPTMDAGVQVSSGGPTSISDEKKTVVSQRPIHPPGQQRVRRESGGRVQNQERQQIQNRNQSRNIPNQQQQQSQQQAHQQSHVSSQHNHQDIERTQGQQNKTQQQQQRQQGWTNRGNSRQRGRGRGGPQNFRSQGQTQGQTGKPKNTLKFDNDYDFEQANTEFEELRSQLAKVKLEDSTKNENDVEKKDDSGNETGAGEAEAEEDVDVVFYDKSKSFFDNISCEAVERSKGRSQRTDWRTERKLNSETFGVPSARRGGYRGRGGYYNRGMGGYRGNFRNNYRSNQGQRNQRTNQPQMNQQNQNVQQPSRQAVVAAAGK